MNQAQVLHKLQTIDTAIRQHQERLEEIAQQLGENTVVTRAEGRLQAAEDALTPWRTKIRDLELEISGVNNKARATEQRLYSGTVANTKEMQDMQDEVASLKRRSSQLEDSLLEAMVVIEDKQATSDDARQALEQARAQWAAAQAGLVAEKRTLEAELADLDSQRTAALPDAEPDALQTYQRLLETKRGQAVSPIHDASCTLCGISQTTTAIQRVRRGQSLEFCSNCGRILVLL